MSMRLTLTPPICISSSTTYAAVIFLVQVMRFIRVKEASDGSFIPSH